jgi:NAD(P)-dependent dehydrogenase (short-subunit alcohol dehydrogenase family)
VSGIVIFGGGEIAEKGIIPVVGGAAADADTCDVRHRWTVARLMAETDPETVVFTAGVSHPQPLAGSSPADWLHELETNLWGAYNVASLAAEAHVKTMVFIASLAGLYGKPNHSGYSASKAGLISLVQSLALEGHDAYAISPGRVDTGMRERDYPGEDPRTRLQPAAIGEIVRDILAGRYTPGDNIVIRMRGHEVLPIEVHRGDGWREKLHVGEPPTC